MNAPEKPTRRAGFSLVELVIAMTLTTVIGAAVTGLFVSQTQFFSEQQEVGEARSVARAANNVMLSELRMVETGGGVVAAAADSITVRSPYGVGVICGTSGFQSLVYLMPVDSIMYARASFGGFAWRNMTTGVYTYWSAFTSVNTTTAAESATCTGVLANAITGARVVKVFPIVAGAAIGTPVMLLQRVTYRFAPSAMVPGSNGLYRRVTSLAGAVTTEELAAPFATTAAFRYFVQNNATAQAPPIADLTTIYGVELDLQARSERPNAAGQLWRTAGMTTAIYFKNNNQ